MTNEQTRDEARVARLERALAALIAAVDPVLLAFNNEASSMITGEQVGRLETARLTALRVVNS